MSLPNLSVRRPIAVTMFFLAATLIGLITFRLLPVEMMPNTSFVDITINIDVRGGIPASEVEKRITKPVEEAIGTVTHLKNILSKSKEGNATVILEFEPGTNMDFAALEVREKFNRIRNKLPPEIEKPVIAKYEYMDIPIMILAVTSEIRTPEELRKIVDEIIKNRIQRVEGVARAEVAGGREGKILVEVDQDKLRAYSLSINELVDTINVNNANLLAGEIKKARNKFLVRTIGEFQTLEEIEDLAVATTKEGSVIRLRDVASVQDSYLEPTAFARVNAQPVVSIYIQKESTGNTVKISRLINQEIQQLKQTLDKDIQLTPTFNQAEFIQKAIDQVKLSLGYGAILATLVLLFFLRNHRSIFVITATIPLSVLITFTLMFFFNITLNVMTLSGLALGIGMLLDNSIVVLENIFKKRQEWVEQFGAGPLTQPKEEIVRDIATSAANEVLLAIVASTITTLVVFLPLVFINPEIKMLYSGIALTITFSLLASLLVSLVLVPMLACKLVVRLPSRPQPQPQETDAPMYTPGVYEAAQKPTAPSEGILIRIYRRSAKMGLTLRYLVIVLAAAAFAFTFKQALKLEREFIGVAEQNKFTIFVEMPTGTRLEVSDKIVSAVEVIVAEQPEVKTVTAKVEPWSSKIYVELLPLNKRKLSTAEVMDRLRPQTDKFESAFIYYEEPEEVGTKEILLELYGYDYEILKGLAVQVAQRMQPIPKFTDVKIRMRRGRPEYRVIVDKARAALLGLSTEDIALGLHTQMRGLVATRYRGREGTGPLIRLKQDVYTKDLSASEERALFAGSEQLKVLSKPISTAEKKAQETETIVRLEERFRKTFSDLKRISIVTPDSEQAYLSQIAEFKFDIGPSEIWRKNKARMVQVSANTGGTPLGTAADKVKAALADFKFPKDYFWQFGGNYDKMIRNQKELSRALILSIALVYMILASLFESFKQPLIILFTVPLAAIGAVIALRLTGKPVGTGVLIGAIMLGGIVVNNAIILIDHINSLRRSGNKEYAGRGGRRQAVIRACGDRLRPILMTSLTTILGLLPMALDKSESANLWSPLAITVIGGLSLSTILTLFVIPGVYLIFEDLSFGKFR